MRAICHTWRIAGFPACFAVILAVVLSPVFAATAANAIQTDFAQSSYYDAATSVLPSASGYEGPVTGTITKVSPSNRAIQL